MKKRTANAFTLIEVLVVVAIIAIMAAILVPSLARARAQAKIAACLSNMSNLPKGVLMFAAEHKGYGQALCNNTNDRNKEAFGPVVGGNPTYKNMDASHNKYAYQSGFYGNDGIRLKPWPIAYASYVGYKSFRKAEQYYEYAEPEALYSDDWLPGKVPNDPDHYFRKFGKYEVITCPADKQLVRSDSFPQAALVGITSYGVSIDVFGVSTFAWENRGYMCWRNGGPREKMTKAQATANGWGGPRLAGKLDKIIRPSEVVIFSDGGNEQKAIPPAGELMSSHHPPLKINGPFLANAVKTWPAGFPLYRHSNKGGFCVAKADGSGVYAKPIQWVNLMDVKVSSQERWFVKRFAPRLRVSPYEVGVLPAEQP